MEKKRKVKLSCRDVLHLTDTLNDERSTKKYKILSTVIALKDYTS